jgi:hypothetical protein
LSCYSADRSGNGEHHTESLKVGKGGLALGDTALAAHDKLLGRHHVWTKESARVTADALDALGSTEEAKRYGRDMG